MIAFRSDRCFIKFLATLDDGVELYNFDERIEFLRTVSKVGIRQLTVQRTPEMIDALYRYI